MSFLSSTPELRAAAERFRAFFDELGRVFVEREDLLTQIALALIGREHVLMTGPPGTAKSGIAAAVLGRIVDQKTGEPSVFARQFTESTVQTDLVGPIDFKTLMATGRSEHFTDEGMLGAVHAFLDEVLDGRDMLLRTTLNVLQERELKQGAKTTQGLIECALMTTNRYLAEVLEGSRETLLAFVDRIAFIGFVPKGFADAGSLTRVLRSQVGGGRKPLQALLTLQDLDVLQDAADRVLVTDEVLGALAGMLGHLELDFASTAKADPSFTPTRYLSTRTAVRLARVLRSACVYDAIMTGDRQEPVVLAQDFAKLRLSLLLSGPDRAGISKLLEHETDPRERRQLSILRAEREIFERALARLPKLEPRVTATSPRSVSALEAELQRAVPAKDPALLLGTAAKLAEAANAGDSSSAEAARLLATTLAHLSERAVRAGTTAGAGPHEGSPDVVGELAELANGLESASGSARPVARWLRGRAIQFLLEGAALASAPLGKVLDTANPTGLDDVILACEQSLSGLRHLVDTCATLRAAGAEEPPEPLLERSLAAALARTADELVTLLDGGFRTAVVAALAAHPDQLDAVLAELGPTLTAIDGIDAKLVPLGSKSGALKARVVGPRVEPLVRTAFERARGTDRLELVRQVTGLVQQLDGHGLKAVIPPADLLRLAASAVVRGEHDGPRPGPSPDHAGYRALRGAEQRVSLSYTIVELALRVAPEPPRATTSPEELVRALGSTVHTLPAELRAEIVRLDLARVERAVVLLRAWWSKLELALQSATSSTDALGILAGSKFFHVTRDEGALLRFSLESRIVAEIFPEAAEGAGALREAIDALESSSSRTLDDLRRGQTEANWAHVFASSS